MTMDTRRRTAAYTSILTVLVSLLISNVQTDPTDDKLRNVHSWKSLEFAFPSEEARDVAIQAGEFKPGGPLPIDIDTYPDDKFGRRIFVTIPRFQTGVPVTLGYIENDLARDGNPLITPFPDWESQEPRTCDGITSVWRIEIDRCGRLWAMDTGKIEETQVCPPQILVYSLDTNQLIHRYKLPKDQYKESSLFVTPVVDVRDHTGQDTFVYIADVTGFAIVVYDHQNTRSWKINNNLFWPWPNYGTFYIKNDVFDLMDGILGMALSPLNPMRPEEDRTLYFHALASRVESYVSTSVLRNYTLFQHSPDAAGRSFVAFANERSSQSAAEAMDRNGVMYFGLLSELAIGCWNSRNYDYGDEFIERIAVNGDTLQFPSGIKVITGKTGRQELWVMTVSFQRLMVGTLSPNETNFRIQAAIIEELVRGTKCDVTSLNINSVSESGSKSNVVTFPE